MTIGSAPICFKCAHLFDSETVEERAGREGFRCAAFPNTQIPDDIFLGDFIHIVEHPDQEVDGIVFNSK